MRNKGFTLIELLAVIVILAIIALIATPIILNIIDNTKESSKERSKELYLDAAEQAIARYNIKNPLVDLSNTTCNIITEKDLEEYPDFTLGNLNCNGIEVEVEMDGEKPKSGSITFTNGKIETETVIFEKTNGGDGSTGDDGGSSEITLASLCGEPISYTTEGELTVGDKYSCNFGTGARNFYILELGSNPVTGTKLESDEVALILEGNYDTTTQTWCDKEGPNPNYNACDADGLIGKRGEIAEAWGLDIEQVVLPSATQIVVADGLSENAYKGYPRLTNEWLYSSSTPYGYWTSTPDPEESLSALIVTFFGRVNYGDLVPTSSDYGVRPVINLKIK